MRKFNSFSNVDMFVDGKDFVLKCARCGEELHRTNVEYLDQNPTVATEDFPAQLWHEHLHSCPAVQKRREEIVAMAISNGEKATLEDFPPEEVWF